MTAIEAMKKEVKKLQRAQLECVTEEGLVIPCHKYRYKILVEKTQSFYDAIKFMEDLYSAGKEKTNE